MRRKTKSLARLLARVWEYLWDMCNENFAKPSKLQDYCYKTVQQEAQTGIRKPEETIKYTKQTPNNRLIT
jgi:hypothetical protein